MWELKTDQDGFTAWVNAGIDEIHTETGNVRFTENFVPFTGEDVLVHPDYDPNAGRDSFFGYGDIALITLQNSAAFTGFNFNTVRLSPICIWDYVSKGVIPNLATKKVSMSGFGNIRTEVPKIRAPPPYYFDRVGYIDNCKYIVPYHRLYYHPRVINDNMKFLITWFF